MIGKLRGVVDSAGKDWAIIDVGGVGYEVSCPARTLARLPPPGEPATLFIETHVREDAIKLYGFASDAERGWFRLLQSVQGVGAKLALAILGALDGDALAQAIALQDRAAMARAPGVGPKVALRIINELKDKIGALELAPGAAAATLTAGTGAAGQAPSPAADAASALANLGYSLADASAAVVAATRKAGDGARTEELIRLGLKELAR